MESNGMKGAFTEGDSTFIDTLSAYADNLLTTGRPPWNESFAANIIMVLPDGITINSNKSQSFIHALWFRREPFCLFRPSVQTTPTDLAVFNVHKLFDTNAVG